MYTAFPINQGVLPDQYQAAKILPITQTISSSSSLTFDLQKEQDLGWIDHIQGVFIDNSANSNLATLTTSEIPGFSIVCPPKSQGVFPFFGKTLSTLTLSTTNDSNVSVTIAFVNTPTPYYTWATTASGGTPGGTSGQVQYNNGGAFGGSGTLDGSGNMTLTRLALGGAAISDYDLTIANGARFGYIVTYGNIVLTGTVDVSGSGTNFIVGENAGVIATRGGTQAYALRVYNTSSSLNANYARGIFDTQQAANTLVIGTETLGTGVGTFKSIKFISEGTNFLDYNATRDGTVTFGGNADINMGNIWSVKNSTGNTCFNNTGVFGFSSSTSVNPSSTFDVGLTRSGVGVLNVTGTTSANLGTLNALAFQVSGNNVISGQATGYGTPTGGSHQSSFAAGSITLANLAACVAQLILDLKAGNMPAT